MCPVRVQPFYSAFSESNVSISNEIIKKKSCYNNYREKRGNDRLEEFFLVGRNIFVSLGVIEHFCSAD